MEELDWPAQSPDLIPIKNLWDELERRLRARPNHPTSVPDLSNDFVDEWKQENTGCTTCNIFIYLFYFTFI